MHSRTITIHGQLVTQYSRDGETWLTNLADLDAYAERVSAGVRGGSDNSSRQSAQPRRIGRERQQRHEREAGAERHSRGLGGYSTEETAAIVGVNKRRVSALLKSGVRKLWRSQVAR